MCEVDLAFETFFSYCKDQSWYDHAYFILSSDHGEKSLDEYKSIELAQSRLNIPLYVKGPEIKNGIDDSYIEGNIDLYASLLALGQIDPPKDIDGRIWPFIGGKKRSQALSELLYVDKYKITIRNKSHCYYWNSNFNQISHKIDLGKNEKLRIFKRQNGKDTSKEITDENLESEF